MARLTPLVVWRSGLTGLTLKTPAASTAGVLFISPEGRTLPYPAPPPPACGADDADDTGVGAGSENYAFR